MLIRVLIVILCVAVAVFLVMLLISLTRGPDLLVGLLGNGGLRFVYGVLVGVMLSCSGVIVWEWFRRRKLGDVDEHDILSSIWIMSNRDEKPLMFYDDVAIRLGADVENLEDVENLKAYKDVENLKAYKKTLRGLVTKHRALFRTPVTERQLKRWKEYRTEKLQELSQRWLALKAIGEDSEISKDPTKVAEEIKKMDKDKKVRKKYAETGIKNMENDWVFRSQFRPIRQAGKVDYPLKNDKSSPIEETTKWEFSAKGDNTYEVIRKAAESPSNGAEASPTEIIEWGLQYLDRRRKAQLDVREVSLKRWQISLVFGVGILNVIVALLVALIRSA
jgi:hypothetical protein